MKIDIYSDNNGVLINKLGISDGKLLKEAEARIAAVKIITLRSRSFAEFNFNTLRTIHREIFEDIYDWAGELRTVDIAKSMLFCRAMFLPDQADDIFSRLAKNNYLKNIKRLDFCEGAGNLFCDLNMLHPFRDGNGRSLREFMFHLARSAGYVCDLNTVRRDIYLEASIKGHTDSSAMIRIMNAIVREDKVHEQQVQLGR
ncbi:MAG: Fic family protein [Selenomonadaceae bacterium]|nr:Fic family protein [Selenomonadaceae bacterium]